jgi:hypothetical protein
MGQSGAGHHTSPFTFVNGIFKNGLFFIAMETSAIVEYRASVGAQDRV